jgi:hypothetical protein
MLSFGSGGDELGLDCEVLLFEVGSEELVHGVFVVGD